MDTYPADTHADRDALWDWNLASDRIHFSPRWLALIGCHDHEVGNTPEEWLQRVHPEDLDEVLRELDIARSGAAEEFTFRHRLRQPNGTYRWVACSGVAVKEGTEVVRLTGSHADVTADTVTDQSTGLPNRLLLLDRLSHSLERARRDQGFQFALLLIDIGRQAGLESLGPVGRDQVLTTAARRLELSLRRSDNTPAVRHHDLVARLDDGQFAILLDGLQDVRHAKAVADRILAELLKPLQVSDRDLFLPSSIGIAVSASGYAAVDDVLRDAEIALHRAHVLGGSRCEVFDTAILKSEQTQLQLQEDLLKALERNEIELFYQPIVSLASNRIIGFEALVRWTHPVLGPISPADFIPIAETTGFIVPLGHWIMREACLRLKAWRGVLPSAAGLSISVNLSAVQLREPALIDQVGAALHESALDAHSLFLELTEGTAMENPTAVKTTLMQLRAMGVRISIDDFGTGYSSLAYVRQLPIDALKVDQSFVRGMETHRGSADIVATLAEMAQQLGVSVVAEGIENEEQLAVIQSIHCEAAQGNLFGRAVDARRAMELIISGLPPRLNATRTKKAGRPAVSGGRVERWGGVWARLPRFDTRAAIAVAVLMSAVPVMWVMNAARPSLPASPAPFDGSQPGRPAEASVAIPLSEVVRVIPAPSTAVASPAASGTSPVVSGASPAASGSARAEDLPSTAEKIVTPEVGVVVGPGKAKLTVTDPAQSGVTVSMSARVVHLHRLGSCEGNLVTSSEGIEYVPDGSGGDGFSLKYGEFLHTLADDRLTITSNDRTYRFRAADRRPGDGGGNQLRDLVASLARR